VCRKLPRIKPDEKIFLPHNNKNGYDAHMLALRKLVWLFAALWVLSQSAVFAHGFEEHSAENSCTICLQAQNDDHATLTSPTSHQIPRLDAQRLTPPSVVQEPCILAITAKARAPPVTV
jgi:hypothetical protein